MPGNGSEGSGSFRAPRHRLTRSITESASLPTTGGRLFGQMASSSSGSAGVGVAASTGANMNIASASASSSGHHSNSHPHHSNSQHLLHQQFQSSRRDRHDDRPANPSVRGSLDLARFDLVSPNRTPSRTPSHSRKTSLLVGSSAEESAAMVASSQHYAVMKAAAATTTPGRVVNEANVREHAQKRLTGLRKSFFDLNAYLTATNQRIYDTYYSILEKTQALQAAVATLGELGELSRGVNDAFIRDTSSIESEVQQQLSALGTLEPQRKRIEALQARIQSGRSRAAELGLRVDAVRRRVEGWERSDAEAQERSRRLFRIGWILVLVAAAVVAVAVMLAQLYGDVEGVDDVPLSLGAGAQATNRAPKVDKLRIFDEL